MKELDIILRSRPKIEFERQPVQLDRTKSMKITKENKKVPIKRSKSERFDDFVFEEPPNDDVEKVNNNMSKKFEKDEDFWKFYNENT